MIKVGLTGGIGSGKTIICRIFELLGAPVYYADIEAKNFYHHEEIKQKMIRLLGSEIYVGDQLDRKKLADMIFRDKDLLASVNHIIHPHVADHFRRWCEENRHHNYVIQEAAILFESNAYKLMDICITVEAPADVRIERIMKRPGMTRSSAETIMENQFSTDAIISRSDFVILNDNNHLVIPQVLWIHKYLFERALNHKAL